MESHAPQAVSGSTLLHFDMRADNLLIDDDHVWFFGWPHACVGAAWFDVVGFIPSVVMQGGPSAEEVFSRYRLGAEADPDAVNCALASLAGYFTRQSLLPPPPGAADAARVSGGPGYGCAPLARGADGLR